MTVVNKKGFPFVLNEYGVCMNSNEETLYRKDIYTYVTIETAYYDGSWKYGCQITTKTAGSCFGAHKGKFTTEKKARQAAIDYVVCQLNKWYHEEEGKKIAKKIILKTTQRTLKTADIDTLSEDLYFGLD